MCARYRGSVRRECREHPRVRGERHLTRVRREYGASFNRERPHHALAQATPTAPHDSLGRGAGPI